MTCALTWSERVPDRLDAVFRRPSAPLTPAHRAWTRSSRGSPGTATRTAPHGPAGSSLALALKELAKARLPDYMVPATIVLLEALPRTPNGKIDRKALPEPGLAAAPTSAAYPASADRPGKGHRRGLAGAAQAERVGAHDNFFDLGANSLLMVQANSRLRTALRRELALVELFQYPTVSALAAHLSRHGDDTAALDRAQERGLSPAAKRCNGAGWPRGPPRPRRRLPLGGNGGERNVSESSTASDVAIIGACWALPGAAPWPSSGTTCAAASSR